MLKNLPETQRKKIENLTTNYTIPADVAFKEGIFSTPARWVFDIGSKTRSGYSLNDIIAKGAFCGVVQTHYKKLILYAHL